MEFILNNLAQVAVDIQKGEAAFAELRENQIQMQKAFLRSEEANRIQREAIGAAMLGLLENQDSLAKRMERVAEAQQLADLRFAQFVMYTNRRLGALEGPLNA